MPLQLLRCEDGRREICVGKRYFPVVENPAQALIPRALLSSCRLSDLPIDVAIWPMGVSLATLPGQQSSCYLYAFQDGSAWARIEVIESLCAGGPSLELLALRQAVCEREEATGEAELDAFEEVADQWMLCYALVIFEDLQVEEALDRIEAVARELAVRRGEIVATPPFRLMRSMWGTA